MTQRNLIPALAIALLLGIPDAAAMAPLPRPVVDNAIEPGMAAPFIGSWSITLPTRDVTDPNTKLAICDLPVRIEQADNSHIVYLGPGETEADAAIELIATGDGTDWKPIAGSPDFFALWVTPDQFYLYDAVDEGEPDWAAPYVYNRCL